MSSDFPHLHCHQEYSTLDGLGRVKDWIDAAKTKGLTSLAETDHGSLSGHCEFYAYAKTQGIKPILGCEMYLTTDRLQKEKETKTWHSLLLAKNDVGYKNLMKILSDGNVNGFYKKPRTDFEMLKKHRDGLIVTSACLAGIISHDLLNNGFDAALERAKFFKENFEDFYLELMLHHVSNQEVLNSALIRIGNQLNIPLLLTNDCHYIEKQDEETHSLLLCVQTKSNVQDEKRFKFEAHGLYLKTLEEIEDTWKREFGYIQFSEFKKAVDGAFQIRDMVSYEKLFRPETTIPDFDTGDVPKFKFLLDKCNEGFKQRFAHLKNGEKRAYLDRLRHELDVIHYLKFETYFLLYWDVCRFAREKGIIAGPGRGSAAGSLVSYLLYITHIDPVKNNLYFERFITKTRIGLPDIDMDFDAEKRDLIKQYLVDKYGENKVADIGTFQFMKSRATVKDVGRALCRDLTTMNLISKQLDQDLNLTDQQDNQIEIEGKMMKLKDYDPELWRHALRLEGQVRNISRHACGIVITKNDLVEHVPLMRVHDRIIVGWMEGINKHHLTDMGFMKLDILGLTALSVIRRTNEFIQRRTGKVIDLYRDIDLKDHRIYLEFSAGNTRGTFQFQSWGITKLLTNVHPDSINDLCAVNALYRPGPLGSGVVDLFIRNKHQGREDFPSDVVLSDRFKSVVRDITRESYFVPIYQEQILELYCKLGGFTLEQAEKFRKEFIKSRLAAEVNKHYNAFVSGSKSLGFTDEEIAYAWKLIGANLQYSFNKSHSFAYATIAAWQQWFKIYYPVEFMAATMSMEALEDLPDYFDECKRIGVRIFGPSISGSDTAFSVENACIRKGLLSIKGVGEKAAEEIINNRPYVSIQDFKGKVQKRKVNSRVFGILLESTVFDDFGIEASKYLVDTEDRFKTKAKNIDVIRQLHPQLNALSFAEIDNAAIGQQHKLCLVVVKTRKVLDKNSMVSYFVDAYDGREIRQISCSIRFYSGHRKVMKPGKVFIASVYKPDQTKLAFTDSCIMTEAIVKKDVYNSVVA